jgi:uncharacterized phage protein (TIGR02218 family)
MSAVDWLSGEVATIAWCWRIVRRDGVTLGLTTHDVAMTRDGLTYQPAPGMRPSAIRQRRGIGGDSFEIEGGLTALAISDAALSAGRWDGARLTLSVADWQRADVPALVIAEGMLGKVTSDGRQFTAELDGRDRWLNAPIVPETSAECRAELGDGQCRVAMAGRTQRAVVAAVEGDALVIAGAWPGDGLTYGRVRWLSGGARGLSATIIAQTVVQVGGQAGVRLTLAALPMGAGAAGEWIELIEGCDKRAATCAARFANIANFRGEPHLPGMDLLTRFPGG